MTLVNGLNRRTFRTLKNTPGIHEVYVRGSYVRGSFIPLSSDIDLAFILTDSGGRSYDTVVDIHRALQKARRWNPSLRDWWSHMSLKSELPVLEAMSALYGTNEWHDENGRATAPHGSWSDDRLCATAAWSQLCLWSGSAFHAFLHPEGRIHDFGAGVKKSLRFAKQMSLDSSLPDDPAPAETLVHVFRAVEQGAARILAGTGSTPGTRSTDEIIRTERAHFLIVESGLSDRELIRRFIDLSRQDIPEKTVTYVLPESALPAWPFPAEQVESGTGPPPMPAPLAREIYMFEALFLPSALRLAPAFADERPRLRRILASLERAQRIYGETWPLRTSPDDSRDDSRALFDEGTLRCEALQSSLLAFTNKRTAKQ